MSRYSIKNETKKMIVDLTKALLQADEESSGEESADSFINAMVGSLVSKYAGIRSFPLSWSDEAVSVEIDDYFVMHCNELASQIVNAYAKIGAEGEKAHNENGISRTYSSSDPFSNAFPDVVQIAKVL